MATASDGLGIYADDANVANARVSVTTHVNKHGHGVATVDRDDFLRAVADELDVIIIPRSDLPDVTDRYGLLTAINGTQSDSATTSNEPDQLRRKALNLLALAEHLEQNPPIDEAAVDALADLIASVGIDTNSSSPSTVLAERLVRAGVRAPEAGDNQ